MAEDLQELLMTSPATRLFRISLNLGACVLLVVVWVLTIPARLYARLRGLNRGKN